MPNPGAEFPIRKVTLNLYEDDCIWMEQHIGHGWSQWVRTTINAEIGRLKSMRRRKSTLSDLGHIGDYDE